MSSATERAAAHDDQAGAHEYADDAGAHEYAWEGLFERSWEAVEEGADGPLRSVGGTRWKRGRAAPVHTRVKRGVMRSVYLVLDCSQHSEEADNEMRPSRLSGAASHEHTHHVHVG